uniref:Uncharacterized protein n=1 Tax=Panagrellus redivivus TaxID=6233 RepID=A0A7E4VNT5_PANRE
MNPFTAIRLFFVMVSIKGLEIAKEVEGGVQILHAGEIELILPESLNFTLKKLRPGQLCIGYFEMCYEATATKRNVDGKLKYYVNYWQPCPEGTCLLSVLPNSAYGLSLEDDNDQIYAFFDDDSTLTCPRKVMNSRATFTIREIPDCPVFVNGAKLPKEENVAKDEQSNTKWIIIICVGVVLLLLVAGAIGFFIFMRFKSNPASVKSEDHVQRVSKSARSPMTHNKPSPMNTPVDD